MSDAPAPTADSVADVGATDVPVVTTASANIPTPAPAPSGDALPDDPAALKTMIAELRKENGSARTNAKAQAAKDATDELVQKIGKAVGLVKDDTPLDPAVLTASLTTSQAEAKQARVELAVFRNASAVGGDPAELLDSAKFLTDIAAIDPTDTAAVQAAITAAVTANPRLGAAAGAPKVPLPNPAQGSGAAAAVGFDAQIAAATAAGNHLLAINLKQQRAAVAAAAK